MIMGGVALGRVFGTEIRIHWSWIPVLALIVVFFSSDLTNPAVGWPSEAALITAIVIAVTVFLSVTAHELAHVVVAARNGLHAPIVVVQLLGGPYVMAIHPRTPGEELRVAAAGPGLSLLIAAISTAVTIFFGIGPVDINTAPIGIQAIQFVAAVLAVFNLFLGTVNLIPGYPLDGARMLHAVAWRRTGMESVATHSTVRVGRYVGWAFVAGGIGMMMLSDAITGLGLVLAGWLIVSASRVLDQRSFLQTLLTGVRVRDALDSNPVRVPPQLTLDVFAAQYMGELLGAAALVERGSELLGLIGTAQIRKIPRRTWAETRTEQAMVPISAVPQASEDGELWSALETLEQSGLDALVVATPEGGPSLFSRRSAAQLVHERAVEEQKRLAAGGGRRGPFGR
jgi:Zn-dependent protease